MPGDALALFGDHSLLLQAIRATLGCEELQQLLAEVEAVLDDDAQVGCVWGGVAGCSVLHEDAHVGWGGDGGVAGCQYAGRGRTGG